MPKSSGGSGADGAKTSTETRGRRGSTSPSSSSRTSGAAGGRRTSGSRSSGSRSRSPAGGEKRSSVSSDAGGHRRTSGSHGTPEARHPREAPRDKSSTRPKMPTKDKPEKVVPPLGAPSADGLSLKSTPSEEHLKSKEEPLELPRQDEQDEQSSEAQDDSNPSEPPKQEPDKEVSGATSPEKTEQPEPPHSGEPVMQTERKETDELPPNEATALVDESLKVDEQSEPLNLQENLEAVATLVAESPKTEEHSESDKREEHSESAKTEEHLESAKTEEHLESLKTEEHLESSKTEEHLESSKTEEHLESSKTDKPSESASPGHNLEVAPTLSSESSETEEHSESSSRQDNLENAESQGLFKPSEISSSHEPSDDISFGSFDSSSESANIKIATISDNLDKNVTSQADPDLPEKSAVEGISEVAEGTGIHSPSEAAGPQETLELPMEGKTKEPEDIDDPKLLEKAESLPVKPQDPEVSQNDQHQP